MGTRKQGASTSATDGRRDHRRRRGNSRRASGRGWQLSWLASGERIALKATICATGVEYSRLGLKREGDFLNRGLYYGAGSSEAEMCKGHVVIVGGGNSAGQAALNFARQTRVTMLVRGESLKNTLSTYLLERIEDTASITVLTRTTLTAFHGDDALEGITYRDENSGNMLTIETHSVFVCIGGQPCTDWSQPGVLHCDPAGYVLTGPEPRPVNSVSGDVDRWSSPPLDGGRRAFQACLLPGTSATTQPNGVRQRRERGGHRSSVAHQFLLSAKYQSYGASRSKAR